jgi:activating signal cointegrator complex subunit 3
VWQQILHLCCLFVAADPSLLVNMLLLLLLLLLQILVATSTLAWGVNTPAHLVVIKGTEYYDAPSRRYVDFPITDVLQVWGAK